MGNILKFLVLLLACQPVLAATYYVSNSGADANNGTSSSVPWQTIAKVNAGAYSAGDSILFHGGDTFSGTISLSVTGSAAAPITVGSYGTGKATINGGTGDGLDCTNCEFLKVSNLALVGSGWTGTEPNITVLNGGTGIFILSTRTSGNQLRSIDISGNSVSGFWYGIVVGYAASASTLGYSGVRISNNSVTNDLSFGINVLGYNANAGGPVNQTTNVYIGYNTVTNIPGDPQSGTGGVHGSGKTEAGGIDVGNVTGITIERNYLSGIAGFGGAQSGLTFGGSTAIGLASSRNFRISNNEIANTRCSTHFDGSAIDIDQDTQNGDVAYNLSYNNVGSAIQVGSYGGFTSNARIHHNVSYNDVRGNNTGGTSEQGAIRLGGALNGVPIFNNSIYIDSAAVGVPSAINWETWAGGTSSLNVQILDNIFKVTGGIAIYHANTASNPTHLGSPVILQNLYDASSGSLLISNDTGSSYVNTTSLAGWQALGFETLSGINYGLVSDAGFLNFLGFSPPTGGFLPSGISMHYLDLSPGSVAIGTGVDPWIEAIDLGLIDYQGNLARHGAAVDLGAASYLTTSSTPALTFRGGNILR
jgi:hypothetical protein